MADFLLERVDHGAGRYTGCAAQRTPKTRRTACLPPWWHRRQPATGDGGPGAVSRFSSSETGGSVIVLPRHLSAGHGAEPIRPLGHGCAEHLVTTAQPRRGF